MYFPGGPAAFVLSGPMLAFSSSPCGAVLMDQVTHTAGRRALEATFRGTHDG